MIKNDIYGDLAPVAIEDEQEAPEFVISETDRFELENWLDYMLRKPVYVPSSRRMLELAYVHLTGKLPPCHTP